VIAAAILAVDEPHDEPELGDDELDKLTRPNDL
jgi:hypothetical protein